MLKLSLLLFAASTALAALGPKSTLTIANKNISPDGSKRAASLVNGIHPGPLITANKGDNFNLNVVNDLSDPEQLRGTSIHWHGLFQKGTNMMDGITGVTQCPIAPKSSFLYSFKADTPGTFWYHSHFDIQYCDGVRGPLIVYDHKDPLCGFYDIDDESTVITLSEWYHESATTIMGISLADSTLINGMGRFPGGPKVDLAVVNVQSKKRYRLRVISISCDPNFIFSIDNHELTVIEVDGVAAKPHTVDSFQIFAGQRYSVVLQANQPVGNYWIRALPNSGNLNISSTFVDGVNSAILRYKGASNAEPKSVQPKKSAQLVETDLHPLESAKAPGKANPDGADVTFNLALNLDQTAFKFTINNASFVPPTVPVLLQILSGSRSAHDLLPAGSVMTVERNKVVQINFQGGLIGGPHPFHLSGHRFSVIKSAGSGRFNFLDPIQRDVVSISQTEGDQVSIRFVTDNPGPWILHCHINFHLNLGLAIVFAEAPEAIMEERNCGLDAWETLCPKWDVLPDSVKRPQIPNSTTTAAT